MLRDVVDTMTHLGVRIGDSLRVEALVDRLPRLAAVVGAEGSGRGDRDVDAFVVARLEDDRVQAQPARARLPGGAAAVLAQSLQLVPALTAIRRLEEGRILDARIDRVGI